MSFVAHGFDPFPELATGLRVQAGGGFVQQHQLRVVDGSDDEGHALLLAARELAEAFGSGVLQFDIAEDAVQPVCAEVDPVDARIEPNDLRYGQFRLEAGGLELYTQAGPGIEWLEPVVIAGDVDCAGRWLQQSFGGAERAGLAGPVGPQETEDLSGLDFEGNITDGLEAAVVYIQAFYAENGLVGWRIHGC